MVCKNDRICRDARVPSSQTRLIHNRLYVGFRMHFFTLFGPVTNLTFTLIRNCRFCHFYTPFNRSIIGSAVFAYHVGHSIGITLVPPFLHTISAPFNRSIIGSTIFLRIQWDYTACSLCKKLIYRIGSAVFTHHSIGLSSIPPFLRTIQ